MLGHTLLWLLVLQVFSLIAFPLAYRAFSRLPDRGWTFSKPLGLLLAGLFTWLIGLTHTIPNSPWTVLLALVAVGALSAFAVRSLVRDCRTFVKQNIRLIAATEAVFLGVFAAAVLLRASVPDIAHSEQPMDFMLLNAVMVSPHYPPADPWMAGEAVSYYYLGYLFIGAVALLTGIPAAVAYNLGLATVAALGAVAAFGLAFNLVRLARGRLEGAAVAGIAAVFLLLVASNLGGVLELYRAAGGGGEGFWERIGVDGMTAREPSTAWTPDEPGWWWRASRVIPGTINEFPGFSFLLGDLHPHVMSIGFLLLTAGIATQAYLQPGLLSRRGLREHWPLAGVAAAAVGALGPLNLWDLPLGIGLVGAALLLNAARNERTLLAGSSVALSDRTAVVGAPGASDCAGAVIVYRRMGGRWYRNSEMNMSPHSRNAGLGTSVAIEGRTIAAGAPGASAVHVFTDEEGVWKRKAVLRAPYEHLGIGGEDFGRCVAMDGGLLAVGAPYTTGTGAVYVFSGEGQWWSLQAEIRDEAAPPGARFGAAIALHDGKLAVGAPGEEAAYVFHLEGAVWRRAAKLTPGPLTSVQGFGRSISLGYNRLAIGAVGAAYVFQGSALGWGNDRIVLPPESSAKHSFGSAVAVQDPYLLVAANNAPDLPARSGSVFAFKREDSAWRVQGKLEVEDRDADSFFGTALAFTGAVAAVGAPGNGHGGVYLLSRNIDKWKEEGKLVSRWRFGRALIAVALLTAAALLVALPFMATFDSNATGVLPLRGLQTRPLHLVLVWGLFVLLVLPLMALILRRLFAPGNWSLMRFGVAGFVAFAPVILWLQPIWGIPFYLTVLLLNGLVVFLFGLHRAGYRLPRMDEMSFAFNSGVTRVVGITLLTGLLLWDGILHGERGAEGQDLALSRLSVVTPMAVVITLAIFAAWTLAYRDSERRRVSPNGRDRRTRNDAHVPALLLLAFAAALVMGVELFHVTDSFGGDLRRLNTVFKAYYQAWILMAVIGGFGLWYLARHFHTRGLGMRLGTAAGVFVLIVAVAAVSYYPLAAAATRGGDMSSLRLDGQAFLSRSAPAEYEAIQWIRGNLSRDVIVLESAVMACPENPTGCSAYTEAGRIAGSTGRATVVGWYQHQMQWRSDHAEILARVADVRTIYETSDAEEARRLLERYGVGYIVVGPRERAAYAAEGLAKFMELGEPVFLASGDGDLVVYRVRAGEASRGETER